MGGPLLHDKNKIRKRAEEKRERERRTHAESRLKDRKSRRSSVAGRIPEDFLRRLYVVEKKSMREIAEVCSCSIHKVAYWIVAYSIPVRNQGDAVYEAKHKHGISLSFDEKHIEIKSPIFLYGIGLGMYWGAGLRSGNAIRIGSTNPEFIKKFINFLHSVYGVPPNLLHFGLTISKDISVDNAISFWANAFSVSATQFQKPIIVNSHKKTGQKKEWKYGFVTLYFFNSKLKKRLMSDIKQYELS